LLLLLVAIAGDLRANPVIDPGDFVARVYTAPDGKTLPYRLLIPADYDKDKDTKYPVVFFLHGAGDRGTDNLLQLELVVRIFDKPENRVKYPCFVIVPQCPLVPWQQWNDMIWGAPSGVRSAEPSGPMKLALKILDGVMAEFNTDPDRLYVTGMSMGGYGTWDCITRFPERFAAAVPMCGGGDEKTVTPEVAKVPVWAFHAADDSAIPVTRSRHMIQAMIQAGGHPHYTQYDAKLKLGHACWDKAYSEPDLLPWLFAQRRGQPDPQPPTEEEIQPPRLAAGTSRLHVDQFNAG
jgi:predicted peptidase